jgi:4-hydroxy-tetrahydrodipicolinate synthase
MRRPTMRLNDAQMNLLRQGLVKSGLKPTGDPNGAFFVGRNPA